jgi:hypothetical protein
MSNYYTIEPLQPPDYASWQPDASVNQSIQTNAGLTSNWKYRQYIQKNANQIMKYNTMESIHASGNNPYTILNTQPTNTSPYLFNSVHDSSGPVYGLRNSDLKHSFTAKEQMNARMVAPSISTAGFGFRV